MNMPPYGCLPALSLESHGAETALIEPDGRTTSFAALAALADAAAQGFGRRRTLVATLAANRRDALAGFLGAQRTGHAVLLLDAALAPTALAALLAAYRPAFLWQPDAGGVWQDQSLRRRPAGAPP